MLIKQIKQRVLDKIEEIKNDKEKQFLILCIFLFIGVFIAEDAFFMQKARVVFCDVGQGDGVIINLENSAQILIDGGPDNKFVGCVGKYMPYFDRTIEYMIISHPDKDHFVGAVEILKRYNVERIFVNGDKSEIAEYKEFLRLANGKIEIPNKDSDFEIAGASIDFIHRSVYNNPNDNSIIFKFLYGDKSILFTGDISEKVEADLLARSDISLQSDILKLAHHGSKTSSGEYFLKVVGPELAIISVGAENNFGHPAFRILKRLENLGIKYKRTDEDGNIEIDF